MSAPRFVYVRGVPIRVVNDAEAEDADVVICMRDVPGQPRLPLAQNFGQCSECERPIYWANSAPKSVRKVCMPCALRIAQAIEREEPPTS